MNFTQLQNTEAKVTKTINLLGYSSGKDVGFRNNNFSYDVCDSYRMIMPTIGFWAIKTEMKCKHLSNFDPVTVQTLC